MWKTTGLVPYYDERGGRVGTATKREVHDRGLRHRAVQLLVYACGRALCYRRHAGQSFAGRLDLFGGHEDDVDSGSLLATAAREAAEELSLSVGTQPTAFPAAGLQQLGRPLRVDSAGNRETSQLFGVRLATVVQVSARDELEDGTTVPLEVVPLRLSELEAAYGCNPALVADGLGRVLGAIADDETFRQAVYEFAERGRWKLCFACTLPGEPGCGCPDNDFYAEHKAAGTYEEAEALARELSWERYGGDFRYWIEPVD
jgi:hypothetical protein